MSGWIVIEGRGNSVAYPCPVALDQAIRPRCNIGPAEVARRRRSALAITALAVGVAAVLLALHVPTPARLALFPFAAGAAVAWMQVVHRFCVAFGALGIENFGRVGDVSKVANELRAADRRRVAQLVIEGSAIGAAVTLIFVAWPL